MVALDARLSTRSRSRSSVFAHNLVTHSSCLDSSQETSWEQSSLSNTIQEKTKRNGKSRMPVSRKKLRHVRPELSQNWQFRVHIVPQELWYCVHIISHRSTSLCHFHEEKLTAVRVDGTATLYEDSNDSKFKILHEWKEPRLKSGQRYVGLCMVEKYVSELNFLCQTC